MRAIRRSTRSTLSRRATPPNAVYERTRAGLAGLVPARAARRILDSALGQQRRTPDAVSAAEMASVLLGPVYRDLSGVLPRAGLRREVKRLARVIRAMEPPASTSIGDRPAADVTAIDAGAVDAEAPPAGATPADAELIGVADVATPVPEPPRKPVTLVEVEPARRPASPAYPADPERVLLALAHLDGLDGAAVFDGSGRVLKVRGDVPDPDALGRVIAAGGGLLGRHGALRTVCVTTTHGSLVAVPVPPQWLAVTGASDLNLGAVYAALSALEEER